MAEKEGLFRASCPPPYGSCFARSKSLLAILSNKGSHQIRLLYNILKNKPVISGSFLRIWRRRRDSNPRWSYKPHTPLAGERLQPLGHFSVTLNFYVISHGLVISVPGAPLPGIALQNTSCILPCGSSTKNVDVQNRSIRFCQPLGHFSGILFI